MRMEDYRTQNILEFFRSSDGLASVIEGYKLREQQLRMAEAAIDAFANQEFLLAEVGTGVGKTYAYLIPAILWADYSGEKVVVATRTKALQEQVAEKDLPALQKILPFKMAWAQAKGRENLLCWNRYISILSGRRSLSQEESEFITAILNWAESTQTGDRKELNLSSRLIQHWDLVNAQRRLCLRERCSFREKCFRLKMLKALEQADIIVANHALLLSDLMIDNQILPEYECLVIDEAHNFEREAFDKCSTVFSWYDTLDLIGFLSSAAGRRDTLLPRLKNVFPELEPELTNAVHIGDRLRELSYRFFQQLGGLKGRDKRTGYSLVLESRLLESPEFAGVYSAYRDWQDQAQLLLGSLKELRDALSGHEEELELVNTISALQGISDAAFNIMEEYLNREAYLHWIEYQDEQAVSISASQVGMSELLYQRLFARMASVLMVSATIAVKQSFAYPIERLGLEPIAAQERLHTLLEDSPFPYEQQACLMVVEDMPDPESREFTAAAAAAVLSAVEAAGGATMVLFTSRQQLADLSEMIRPILEKKGYELLVQNEDGDFNTLINQFRSGDKSVLMGLDTFWEGIDLKGDLLRCLVIVKLPFRAPNEPYSSACIKDCHYKGKNSFNHFSLPDAIVRFKQGVGRLIRSEQDHGAVVVLDHRLLSKSYGRSFTDSIPIGNIRPLSYTRLYPALKDWLQNTGR